MCTVYNQVGCLTTIKSHLRENNIHEYHSVNELINFQKNYPAERHQVTLDHILRIEEEKKALVDKVAQLDHSIDERKSAVENQLLFELEELKSRVENLSSANSNIIDSTINFFKRIGLRLKIHNNKRTFNFKIENSIQQLTEDYNEKSSRYQYIVSYFEDAVRESSLPQLQEIDQKKRAIDQLNNSIYGAIGEQKVVSELKKLSEEYFLINDFTRNFYPPIYNRKENDHIQSIQIDHVLVSTSGIFLIETKNWSPQSLNNLEFHSPVHQINRTNFAMYIILNGERSGVKYLLGKHHYGDRKIPLRNLIVFINQKPTEEFQHVKTLTLNELIGYVKYFKPCFSNNETQAIANYLLNL